MVKVTFDGRRPRSSSASRIRLKPESTLTDAGDRGQEPLEPDRVGEHAGLRRLGEQRRQQLLLVLDPGKIGGGERVPVPGERQRGDAVDVVQPGRQVQPAVGIIDRERHADVDAAQRVDDLDEAEEVDLDVVVDGQAGGLLDRLAP